MLPELLLAADSARRLSVASVVLTASTDALTTAEPAHHHAVDAPVR